jgi:hypothetical protein
MFGNPRLIYSVFVALTLITGVALALWAPVWLWLWWIMPVLAVMGAWDLRSHHNVLRNYPILGHMRYMLEFIRPEHDPARTYADIHPKVEAGAFLCDAVPEDYLQDWQKARAQHF